MKRIWLIVVKEIREALPATIFFLILFHMISLTKAVVLDEYNFAALRAFGATVGALIVAKAILVVEMLPIANFFSSRRISQIFWKTLLYGLVVLSFQFLEELIPRMLKHNDLISAIRAMLGEVSWALFAVLALWILGGLFLYAIASELVKVIGPDKLRKILFDRMAT